MNSNSRGLSAGSGERDVLAAATVGRVARSPEDYWQRLLETDTPDPALSGARAASTATQSQGWVTEQSWEILEQ